MRHEMGWDNGRVFCSCGWISDPSGGTDQETRRDQQSQFIQHKWEQTESVKLGEGDDSNQ